jgi:2-haloacid dehalogenase
LDLGRFEVLTFDCYGTLIDWESGISAAFAPIFEALPAAPGREALLEAYARHEQAAESGAYLPYRHVLANACRGVCVEFGVPPRDQDVRAFVASIGQWPAFSDTSAALERLATRYRLGVITNCDDDLFELSRQRLGIRFDWVITAEQARSYKPDRRNFELAVRTIGRPKESILHVAQSLYHDHVPAQELGLATAWIDRRRGLPGFGATPVAVAEPDLVLPDLRSLAELAVPDRPVSRRARARRAPSPGQ